MEVCVFCCLLTVLCVGVYGNSTNTESPDRVTLSSGSDVWVEGDKVELICEIWGAGFSRQFSVRWSRAENNAHPITFKRFNETMFSELEKKSVTWTATLILTPRREDNGAQYECAAVLDLKPLRGPKVVKSQPITITVHYKPITPLPSPESVSVQEGTDLIINCTADGNPRPQYNWTVSNNIITSSSSSNKTSSSITTFPSITISSVQKKHQGNYTCTAYNYLGQVTRKVSVTVCSDLVITPASVLVEFGAHAEVNCSIKNKPETQYLLGWESKINQNMKSNETSVMWTVDSVTQWEEVDGLQCFLSEQDQCMLNVNLIIYKSPDRVTLTSESDVWVEEDEVELMCEVWDAGPGSRLSVLWSIAEPNTLKFTHLSKTTFPDLATEKKNGTWNATLTLRPGRENNGAQYECAAVLDLEPLGRPLVNKSQPITITVHYKPITPLPSYESVSVQEGTDLIINCTADGNPRPQYNWTVSNNIITSSSSSSSSSSSNTSEVYRISNVQKKHQGNYTCAAYNDLGQVTRTVTVHVTADHSLLILTCAVVSVVLLVVVVTAVYRLYYRRKRVGEYILKQLKPHRHHGHVDHTTDEHTH